jgi:hypothetical protein
MNKDRKRFWTYIGLTILNIWIACFIFSIASTPFAFGAVIQGIALSIVFICFACNEDEVMPGSDSAFTRANLGNIQDSIRDLKRQVAKAIDIGIM